MPSTSDTAPATPRHQFTSSSSNTTTPHKTATSPLISTPETTSPFSIELRSTSPNPPRHAHTALRKKLDLRDRPETPLDFLLNLSPSVRRTHARMSSLGGGDKQVVTTSARPVRTSIDEIRRLEVDPAIKGVPQGWDDDFSVEVPQTAQPQQPAATTLSASPSQGASLLASRLHHPLRDSRIKLSSFSGKIRDRLDPAYPNTNAASSSRDRTTSYSQTSQRTSARVPDPLPGQRTIPARSASLGRSRQFESHGPLPTSPTTSSAANTQPHLPSLTEASPTDGTFSHLFTPHAPLSPISPTAPDSYTHSMTSTHSSDSRSQVGGRERVLGLRKDPTQSLTAAGQSKLFQPQSRADVLPFASNHPFSAWDIVSEEPHDGGSSGKRSRRPSLPLNRMESKISEGASSALESLGASMGEAVRDGWKDLQGGVPGAGGAKKRVWVDDKGEEVGGVYRIGWEREVLDLESRLHEALYDLAGERHSFAPPAKAATQAVVLDIGTGLGLWPISQALTHPNATFVGLDLVPCQIDLDMLADAERTARSTSVGVALGKGMWEGIRDRVTWDRANFLDTLPYDSGVFSHVHLRFLGLAVPETKWPDLIDEAIRVLAPGGTLEIVELYSPLPPTAPVSLQHSFASMLLADLIQPQSALPIQFALLSASGLRPGAAKTVFEWKWSVPVPIQGGGSTEEATWLEEEGGPFREAGMAWVSSALEYKGTGLVKQRIQGKRGWSIGRRAAQMLGRHGGKRWTLDTKQEREGSRKVGGDIPDPQSTEDQPMAVTEPIQVWAWAATKA